MKLLQQTGGWVRGLRGWRRAFFAFACGAISALGFAPVEFFPALLLGFAALTLVLDGADESEHPVRDAAVAGWAFAFGQYLIGLHWIGYAFLVDPDAHLWQMPFALLFLTAGLALYAGLACGLALYFWQDGPARLLVFAVLYAAGEWVRGHALTGFPWNLAAYGWGDSLAILQCTAVIGAYGLTFLTILLGASLAEFAAVPRQDGARNLAPVAMLLLFVALWGWGSWRLAAHPTQYVSGVQLRLVQPDIPQAEKYKRPFMARNWQRLIALSAQPSPAPPTHIIWPEAAPDFLLQRSAGALDEITVLTGPGRTLMTGAQRERREIDQISYFNSLFTFGPGGRLDAVYDKFHLVPFGEYVPFAPLLNRIGITKLTQGQAGFDKGDGPHVYQLTGAPPMSPLICYEIIFPGAVTDHQNRPGWFVNVTDDSWFGPWAGPHQHLLIASVRAIEEAIPVARAANTGISAIIDPSGRIIAQLGLGEMGHLDGKLPQALGPTTYARFGDLGFLLLLILATLMAWIQARK
ncbi:MAG TPA: apolipoprotein N-acyltransferase [Rhizomicrobium sp.]|nr:apolipoprotein N-acyltransferase [Rhizomicrobium sp.]